MDFIDKLEQFLLRPRAKVYHNNSIYRGINIFELGCDRCTYGEQNKEVKKDGVTSMIKKLRDNNYNHPEYTMFFLDLIGWDYFNDILKLEPTDEDLFNLYKVTGYGKGEKLSTFLKIVKDKELKLKLFKYGYDYTLISDRKSALKLFIPYLKDLNLNDDGWINALKSYINNSIKINEKELKETIIEVCIECVKDNEKCEILIKELFNEEVDLGKLFTENKVDHLKVDSKNIIKHFSYTDDAQVGFSLQALYQLLKLNEKEIGSIAGIDYYKIGTEYSFITYNDKDRIGIETIKFLINEMLPVFKDLKLDKNSIQKTCEDYNDNFLKRLIYIKLSRETEKAQIKEKTVKI